MILLQCHVKGEYKFSNHIVVSSYATRIGGYSLSLEHTPLWADSLLTGVLKCSLLFGPVLTKLIDIFPWGRKSKYSQQEEASWQRQELRRLSPFSSLDFHVLAPITQKQMKTLVACTKTCTARCWNLKDKVIQRWKCSFANLKAYGVQMNYV